MEKEFYHGIYKDALLKQVDRLKDDSPWLVKGKAWGILHAAALDVGNLDNLSEEGFENVREGVFKACPQFVQILKEKLIERFGEAGHDCKQDNRIY